MRDEYFEWIYDLIFSESHETRLSYRKLLQFLYDSVYYYEIDRDINRAKDGIDLRYIFGANVGYSVRDIRDNLDTRPCSVLEVMVALAYRIEDQIMDDSKYGNRTGQWFWNMVVSLGLNHMSDDCFDRAFAEEKVKCFMRREYDYNGKGGLFTLRNPPVDLTTVEIWSQAMWYLDENFDFSL